MLVRNREDIASYGTLERFNFAKEMADVWFGILDKMSPEL